MSIDTRVISQNGHAIRSMVDGTKVDSLYVDGKTVGIAGEIHVDQTSSTSTSYPKLLANNPFAMKGEGLATITLDAIGYLPAVPSDIGKFVAYGDFYNNYGSYSTGILLSYNNSTRVWLVQVEELDYFQIAPAGILVLSDSGAAGSMLSPAAISRSFNRAAAEVSAGNGAVSGYIQAEYEDIRITDDVISSPDLPSYIFIAGRDKPFPNYIDGQIRINTRGDYPLILGSDASDFMSISKSGVEVHNLGPVDIRLSNHTEYVIPAWSWDTAIGPIGGISYHINTPQDFGQGPLEFATITTDIVPVSSNPNSNLIYGRLNFNVKASSNSPFWQAGVFGDVTTTFGFQGGTVYATDDPALCLKGDFFSFNYRDTSSPAIDAELNSYVFQKFVGINTKNPTRLFHVDQSASRGELGQYPSTFINNSNPSKNYAVATLVFNSSGYNAATPASIGQTVYANSSYSNGILLSYDNVSRTWRVQIEELDYFNTVDDVSVYDGVAFRGGTLSAPATIFQTYNRANFEVSSGNGTVSGYMQAEYEDINLTEDINIPTYMAPSDGQVRINTRGDYPLILGSDSSDLMSLSNKGLSIHQHQYVSTSISRHGFYNELPINYPIGSITFNGPNNLYGGITNYGSISGSSVAAQAQVSEGMLGISVQGYIDSTGDLCIFAANDRDHFDNAYAPPYILIRNKLGINTTSEPASFLKVAGLPMYTSNALALAAGLTPGAFYRDNSNPSHVMVVI